MQSGAAELIDNEKGGPFLTSSSEEEDGQIIRKRRNVDLSMLSQENSEINNNRGGDDDSEADKRSIRSLSDRLKMESISVFYSKTMYPTSLGMIIDDDFD